MKLRLITLPELLVLVLVVLYIIDEWNQTAHYYAPSPGGYVGLAFAAAGLIVGQVVITVRRLRAVRRRWGWLALTAVAAGSFIPLASYGAGWLAFIPFFIADCALLLPIVVAIVFGVVAETLTVVLSARYHDVYLTLYQSIGLVFAFLFVYGLSHLADLIAQLHASRRQEAELAVLAERTRFTADLDVVVGDRLRRARDIATASIHDPGAHGVELQELIDISRELLVDVRAVARGERTPSLTAELHIARQMLTAAGIALRVSATQAPLEPGVEALAVDVIRESLTAVVGANVAQTCSISLITSARGVALQIATDTSGPIEPSDQARRRATELGASIASEPNGVKASFPVQVAVVPLPIS